MKRSWRLAVGWLGYARHNPGTRVMVSVVLDNLAAGEPPEEIMRGYHLEREDVQAAMQYAAELARETVIPFTPDAA